MRIALLDDYQGVARQLAPWEELAPEHQVTAFHDHLPDEAAVAERLQPFEAVMALRERTPFPRSLLERLPNLKLLCTAGMGNTAIDLQACTELGIVVCGTPGSARSTMELSWALMMAVMRNVPGEDRAMRQGRWQTHVGTGLDGKTLGLLGLGRIGAMMAGVARAFDMKVIAWSENLTAERAEEAGAERVPFNELLQRSDVVSIHLRLSERTRRLLGAHELGLLKPAAYLINTSRGPIVDEAALVDALQRKAFAGAGLDVFDTEPMPAEHPLYALDNVVLTPHLGYVTREVYAKFYGETLNNIKAWLHGSPERVLNPDVLPNART